jgi:hypothetical protein
MTARAQRVAKKKQSEDEGQYTVGDHITAKLSDGRKVKATIRALSQQDGDMKLIIDYGHEETATIGLEQVYGLESKV